MANALSALPPSAAVAIIRLRSLGDCVLTTPALSLLHQFRPDLRIAVVVENSFAAVFEGNPAVQAILPPAVPAVRKWNAELCVNLHGGTRSMTMTASSGARLRAGFAHFRYAGIYNLRIPTAQEILGVSRTVHTAEHLASAMFWLGVPVQPVPRASLFAERPRSERPYAVLHPVAGTPEKTWPAEGFLRVAAYLDREYGLEPVFIAGPGEDLSAFGRYRVLAGAPLSCTKSLIAGASLFIGNDSGPAHMAAAFGIPLVALFGPSDSVVWAPWRAESRVLRDADDIRKIPVDHVFAAIEGLQVVQ
jgi:ADP-heptose:LPS heptosyltransferase